MFIKTESEPNNIFYVVNAYNSIKVVNRSGFA